MKKISTEFYVQHKINGEWETICPSLPIRTLKTAQEDIEWCVSKNIDIRENYRIIKWDNYRKETLIKK